MKLHVAAAATLLSLVVPTVAAADSIFCVKQGTRSYSPSASGSATRSRSVPSRSSSPIGSSSERGGRAPRDAAQVAHQRAVELLAACDRVAHEA